MSKGIINSRDFSECGGKLELIADKDTVSKDSGCLNSGRRVFERLEIFPVDLD